MANAGGEIEVTAVVMFGAIVWLIGHGIHGVIFLALPVLMWPRKEVEEQTLAY
jgi:hypothetical protein